MGNRRILITGAFGFTGRYVSLALENAGFETCALKANLCDETALKAEVASIKPFAVLHLAGISCVNHGNIADFYRVNLLGTLGLLQALDSVGSITGPVVLASSANIYGNAYQDKAIKESFLPHPANNYAASKLAMEEMAALWNKRLPITIIRPFNYTGVGQSDAFVVPKIVNAFRERRVLKLGNIDVWRDFSDVRDIARWYAMLIKRNITNQTINFCSGRPVSLNSIIEQCGIICNYKPKIESEENLKRKNELIRLYGDRTHFKSILNDFVEPKYTIYDTLQWMLS